TPRGVASPRDKKSAPGGPGALWEILTDRRRERSALTVLLHVGDDITDGLEFFGLLIRDLNGEFLFKRHHQLHSVEGIGTKVFDETGVFDDLFGIHAELIDDDVSYFV